MAHPPAPQKLASTLRPDQDGEVWYSTATSSSFPAHFHDEWELNLVVRGTARYDVEGRAYELSAGDAFWMPPFAVHHLVESTPDLTMWVFTFRHPLFEASKDRYRGLLALRGPALLLRPGVERLGIAADAGCEALRRRSHAVTNRCLSVVASAMGDLAEDRTPRPVMHRAVRRAVQEIDALEGDLSLPTLAERCRLSEAQLSRLFARQMSVPLVYYRNHQRIQAFVQAHTPDRANLLSSAFDIGFGSYAQFSRAFLQVTGQPPRAHFRSLALKRATRARVLLR